MDHQRLHEEAYRWEVIAGLMQDCGDALTQYCRTWLGESVAEEVTLEVFLTARELLPQYRPEATLRSWLFGIARNKCQQAYRNRGRRQAIIATCAEEVRLRTQAAPPGMPGEGLEQEQLLAQLDRSLARLPREERHILTLRYWKGQTLAEISAMLGMSPKTIRRRLQHAEERLKELMNATLES